MQAASRPSSLADQANSAASVGPMTAITVREAWLSRFTAAKGKVMLRNRR